MLYVCIPVLTHLQIPTKREVSSAVGKFFDVLGWFFPSTVQIKILLQLIWKEKLGWDDPLPASMINIWTQWKEELPLLSSHAIPRRLMSSSSFALEIQLHGFSDASQTAYGCVIYLRVLHQDTSISVRIVTAKTKVAPLACATIRRLELCVTLLLPRLLSTVARDLNIPTEHLYAWCDSSAVLGWIKSAPSKMKTYVSNRVQKLVELVPPGNWRYVSTNHNPADHASRGLFPRRLIACDLWWQGPAWLKLSPAQWPQRQDLDRNKTLPELKATALIVRSPTGMDLWNRFSTFQRPFAITAWCK